MLIVKISKDKNIASSKPRGSKVLNLELAACKCHYFDVNLSSQKTFSPSFSYYEFEKILLSNFERFGKCKIWKKVDFFSDGVWYILESDWTKNYHSSLQAQSKHKVNQKNQKLQKCLWKSS